MTRTQQHRKLDKAFQRSHPFQGTLSIPKKKFNPNYESRHMRVCVSRYVARIFFRQSGTYDKGWRRAVNRDTTSSSMASAAMSR